ncbi:helix-turn-helix domain-containing protein [Aquibacillus albus]|uniref:Transcriptional regulator with XRE-family HTH domain n=1 Tax=Aquibacillus albus TaxID=1168171 RepID=A0ABS2MZU5_9BACI|nr:helix-turn-helix transcriptional regulator [Aquibacillus albus]MBM7571402.1 transcriptional regulator with XRE-family HTH domain [Aquibacillus albus]
MDRKEHIGKMFGKNLKHLRSSRGQSQVEFAEEIKLSDKKLSKLELGQNHPSFTTLIKLHRKFGFKVDPIIQEICENLGPYEAEFDDEE